MGNFESQQYTDPELLVLEIDGSEVTTSLANTALLKGKHIAKVMKGEGDDSNLVTIQLNLPAGIAVTAFFQEITVDCICRREEAETKNTIKVRTLELDGTTKEDDADFIVLVALTRGILEFGR
jgi:hypothetical protein